MLKLLPTVLSCALASGLCAQVPPPSPVPLGPCTTTLPAPLVPGPNVAEIAVRRENALAPAYLADRCKDYKKAYEIEKQVLLQFPNDGRVLNVAAYDAERSGKREEAIALYEQALPPAGLMRRPCSWSTRSSLLRNYQALARWPEFEDSRQDMRKAAREGDQCLSVENGYPIDMIQLANELVKVIEFPVLSETEHTRDRFDFYDEKNFCTGFTPYADLVWDGKIPATVDSQNFALTMHPTPESSVLLKSYTSGEPDYYVLRTDFETLMKTHERPAARPCTSAAPRLNR